MIKKIRIKKGDTVYVIAGEDKGKTGEVVQVNYKTDRVLVNGVNIVKKHKRSNQTENKKPQIVEQPAPIHISNVMYYCGHCNKPTRLGIKIEPDGKKHRFCKRCETVIK